MFPAQGSEIGDFLLSGLKVLFSERVDGVAGAVPWVGKIEQSADLFDAEAEGTRSADEAQPREFASAVAAIFGGGTGGLREQTGPLIIAYGL